MTKRRLTGLVALWACLVGGCQSPTGGDALFQSKNSKSSYKQHDGPPRTPLQTARDGEDPAERLKAFKTLQASAPSKSGEEAGQDVAELQLSFQRERDPLMRARLVETLASYTAADVEGTLNSALTDPSPTVRMAVVNVCAKRGEAGVPRLAEISSRDGDVDVKLAAARALGKIGGADATAALGAMLDDSNPAIQYRAMQSLEGSTGKRLGNDINAWKSYVQSGVEPKPPTFVERISSGRLF